MTSKNPICALGSARSASRSIMGTTLCPSSLNLSPTRQLSSSLARLHCMCTSHALVVCMRSAHLMPSRLTSTISLAGSISAIAWRTAGAGCSAVILELVISPTLLRLPGLRAAGPAAAEVRGGGGRLPVGGSAVPLGEAGVPGVPGVVGALPCWAPGAWDTRRLTALFSSSRFARRCSWLTWSKCSFMSVASTISIIRLRIWAIFSGLSFPLSQFSSGLSFSILNAPARCMFSSTVLSL
mmetsp:Transcript_72410/g.228246  ORF Transcript_72410/g.228246 Transcript_72410/m.228246 type:complete len:239 (-) Transcript_72410:1469-2185(-)